MTDVLHLGAIQTADDETQLWANARTVFTVQALPPLGQEAIRTVGTVFAMDQRGIGGTGVAGWGGFEGVQAKGGQYGLRGTGDTVGVYAESTSGDGVHAFGHGAGMLAAGDDTGVLAVGTNGPGVLGTGQIGVLGRATGTNGVQGETNSDLASGVYGQNNGRGYGVAGRSEEGTGVLAESEGGFGLRVVGRMQLSRSAVELVNFGQSSVQVTLSGVTRDSSAIIATVQGAEPGLWVTTVDVQEGSFTIHLNAAADNGAFVAWFELISPTAKPVILEQTRHDHFSLPTEWPPPGGGVPGQDARDHSPERN